MLKRYFSVVIILSLVVALGCSAVEEQPAIPGLTADLTSLTRNMESAQNSQTHLWGYFEVTIDTVNQTVEAVADRSAMFTANVVNFLNKNPLSMKFKINEVGNQASYIDIDINVRLTHPFPGMPQYNGYDVRGIFMGNGSASLTTGGVFYAVNGTDQYMMDDPDTGGGDMPGGGPDGYTRWFNVSEFSTGGMPLISYTQGNLASKNFAGTATLNPYKYFADGLGTFDNVWTWLNDNAEQNGIFSSGATNERNYYLRFPTPSPSITYGYAVIANWINPDTHPANATEAVGLKVVDNSDVWFVDSANFGGNMNLDISVFDWGSSLSGGMMEAYDIVIESSVLSTPYTLNDTEMIPIGGDENISIYNVEIPADDVTMLDGNWYWVIVQYPGQTYANEFGIPNNAEDETLAAFFRYSMEVSNENPTGKPVCDIQIEPCTLKYWDITDHVAVGFDASASYEPDGEAMTYHWDFDGDGIFDEPVDDENTSGDPIHPVHDYYADGTVSLKLIDINGAFSICTIDVDITEMPSKNIPLRKSPWEARDLAVDPSNGELHILYYWHNTSNNTHWIETYKYSPCDLYPEPTSAFHTQPQGMRFNRIEVSGTHYSVIGGPLEGASGKVRNITPEGVDLGPNFIMGCTDLWVFNDGGLWPYSHCTIYPFPNPPWNPSGYSTFLFRAPYETTFNTWHQSALIYWGTQPVGPGYMYAGFIRGVESVASGHRFWTLQDPGNPAIGAYYCNRWSLDGSPAGLSGVSYNNAYFGTGSRTEADTCWYDAMDLTRLADNTLVVLDKLADGRGRIKGFTGSATGGSSLGGFDIPDQASATPLRIDSSDYIDPVYGNLLYLLHGSAAEGFYMSIYFDSELPW